MGVRGSRRVGALVAGLLAVLAIAVSIPANVVTGYLPAALTDRRLPWTGLLTGFAAVIAGLTLLLRRLDRGGSRPVLAGQVPAAAGWVDRAELEQVIAALTGWDGPVALTTGLAGAGGFGKTTLAAQACRHKDVARRFRDGIVWVTVGQDTDGAALAARISETVRNLGGDGPAFTSLEQAGQALAAALTTRGGRVLLVADDVWTVGQLAPFTAAGQAACPR